MDKHGCVIICLYTMICLSLVYVWMLLMLRSLFNTHFDMKDLVETYIIFGIKIIRTNQSHYIEKILRKFGQFDSTSVRISYDPSIHMKKE